MTKREMAENIAQQFCSCCDLSSKEARPCVDCTTHVICAWKGFNAAIDAAKRLVWGECPKDLFDGANWLYQKLKEKK